MGMASKGWIKLHREILDKAIFHNEKLLKVFVWCTLKATHEEYDQLVGRQIVHLKPGQFVTGRHKASEELRLKPSTAWDYLKVLESNNTINIKSDNKFSIVTIVNWALYQSVDSYSDNETNSSHDNKSTTNQHKQEHKNNKKKEVYSPDFENFYSLYPNPMGKAQTYKNWQKVIRKYEPELILQSAKKYKKSVEGTDKSYVTTSYNFLGQKAVYMDYLPGNGGEVQKAKKKESVVRELSPEDLERLFAAKREAEMRGENQ